MKHMTLAILFATGINAFANLPAGTGEVGAKGGAVNCPALAAGNLDKSKEERTKEQVAVLYPAGTNGKTNSNSGSRSDKGTR